MQGGRQPPVEFRRVALAFGDETVLRELSFRVGRSETFVLVGRSGAGKSSALRLVNRLLEPDSGEVRVDGRPTSEWDPIELRRRTGYVLQGIGLFPHLTVRRNAGMVPELLGWEEERRRERAERLLEMVGLPAGRFGDRYPTLSHRLRKSLLFVTHDVREALFLGDRVGLLEDGSLAFEGPPEAFRESDHPLVRSFLGRERRGR